MAASTISRELDRSEGARDHHAHNVCNKRHGLILKAWSDTNLACSRGALWFSFVGPSRLPGRRRHGFRPCSLNQRRRRLSICRTALTALAVMDLSEMMYATD
jgi:hypothetical protein